ncbi:hypothetical protein GCM10010256_74600 [Streptomyces coeruleorubidus]|nr:hypothetical protein GCM10010256_74600 [Streptomyces coeruleorubidus]
MAWSLESYAGLVSENAGWAGQRICRCCETSKGPRRLQTPHGLPGRLDQSPSGLRQDCPTPDPMEQLGAEITLQCPHGLRQRRL